MGRSEGFPGGSLVKKKSPPGNKGLIPGSGRSPGGGGNGNALWYSCLEKSMDSYIPQGLKESDVTVHARDSYT